jgi:hypothetical protein
MGPRRLLRLAAGGRLGGNRPRPIAGSNFLVRIRNAHINPQNIGPSGGICEVSACLAAIQRQGMAQPAMAGSQNQSTVCNSWDRQASGGGRNGMNAQAAQYQGLGAVMRRGRQMFGRKQVKTTPLSCDPHHAPVGAVPGGGGGATPTAHAELSQVPSALQICPGPCDGGVQS